jgi:thiamine pyrophosphate-dependent acetolactate synthase large subunit-like protein
MMNSQALETAVRLGQELTVVILRDNAYSMIFSSVLKPMTGAGR